MAKDNHLVANCVIFHNVFSLSRVLHNLQSEGYPLETGEGAWAPSGNSPYVTQPINRFGRYELDREQRPPELVSDFRTCARNPYSCKMKESVSYPTLIVSGAEVSSCSSLVSPPVVSPPASAITIDACLALIDVEAHTQWPSCGCPRAAWQVRCLRET
jgi:hypothetical protein